MTNSFYLFMYPKLLEQTYANSYCPKQPTKKIFGGGTTVAPTVPICTKATFKTTLTLTRYTVTIISYLDLCAILITVFSVLIMK